MPAARWSGAAPVLKSTSRASPSSPATRRCAEPAPAATARAIPPAWRTKAENACESAESTAAAAAAFCADLPQQSKEKGGGGGRKRRNSSRSPRKDEWQDGGRFLRTFRGEQKRDGKIVPPFE